MKKMMCCVLVAALLPMSHVALAGSQTLANRAVTINMGSIGGKLDAAAMRAVRQIVGYGIASGTVDTFQVSSPKGGAPMPIEGGLAACVEAGFGVKQAKFNEFVQDLKTIKAKSGTFYSVAMAMTCANAEAAITPDPILCTMDVKSCPDGSSVGRTGPSCAFAACPETPIKPEPIACTKDAKLCPDGSAVGRIAPFCKFSPCPSPVKSKR